MASEFSYRLEPLLEQKEELKKDAERELGESQKELESQQATLRSLQQALQALVEKRQQMRRELLSKPADGLALNAMKVQERVEYAKAVALQIEDAQGDVNAQRSVVDQCETRVQEAKKQVQAATREVEILQKHRAKQEERFVRELREKEDLELDEIGNVLYMTRRRSS
jgi:flagellar biosynthesis chaperone FliJ